MANNTAGWEYFIGFKYSDLSYPEQAEVLRGQWEGYLRIVDGFVRSTRG